MSYTRRDIVRLAAAAAATVLRAARPDSVFGGVQVGAITYSFRALPSSAEQVLKYLLDCGISAIELMANVAESYAGAPERPTKDWRLSVSMDKYKAFRALYNDAGVSIYAFKLPPTMGMSDAEYDYIWNVAETLGANHVTMELPNNDELLHRVAEYAAKRTLRIAFHTHGQGGESGFEKALGASPYTALNLDVGHYWGVNGVSPVPVIVKYHDRIASLHLKDRKGPASGAAGPNMPWGQGETPLQEILLTLKKNAYKFPASIEYEYNTPEGSDVVTEVKKCVQYCKDVLVG